MGQARATAWRAYLVIGVTIAIGVLILPVGVGRDLVYCLIGASGVAAILCGVRRNRPSNRSAWYLMAAGNATWVLGDALYSFYEHVELISPFPSLADVPYLAAYPLLAAGILVLVRSRGVEREPTSVLDSAILTVGVGLLSWVSLIEPTWEAGGTSLLSRIVGIAYPVGDVLLFAMLMRLVTARNAWNVASRLLAGSIALLVFADSLFQAASWLPALEVRVDWLDPLWLGAYVLWGAAALHPSMRQLSGQAPLVVERSQTHRLVALAAAALILPGVLVVETLASVPLDAWPVVGASIILIALILARMIGLVRKLENQTIRMTNLAETDNVTGLANRRRFVARLAELLGDRGGATALFLVINVERFAEINDTLGERTGDAILHAVGARLFGHVDPSALVVRLADHAFGVLDPAITATTDCDVIALRLRTILERPYDVPHGSVSVEVAVAALFLPGDATEPAIALHRADLTIAAAKTRPDRIACYQAEMETGGALALVLVSELRDALENGQIVLHYQPQVNLNAARVFGVEALARWQHPHYGLLGPDSFIPATEQSGLIGAFTRYVLDRALQQNARWREQGLNLTVAVNLSVRNLLDPELVNDVTAALARHGLGADSLELEITESSAMVDPRRSMEVLGVLADMGVTLSVDDYGTGHSSLAYLQRLPVRRLKIDRSFVTDVVRDAASAAIVRSTIDLARNLDLDVVAEGVEDDVTLLSLRDMLCPAVQGFGISRPVAPPLIPELITRIEARIPAILGTFSPSATRSPRR